MANMKRLFTILLPLAVALSGSALFAQTETADSLFARARDQARSEHKNVLLDFSASWCSSCKLYERFLEDSAMKPITEKAYVVVRIDVGERANDSSHHDTPGGFQLRGSLIGKREPSYPILVITDADGKPLIDSFRNGKADANIGYPDLPEEIDWYMVMLKRTAPSLTPDEMETTRQWLKKHSTTQH